MSWVDVPDTSDFTIDNLPYGAFTHDGRQSIGVAIGDHILDLGAASADGLLPASAAAAAGATTLDALLALHRDSWSELRDAVHGILVEGSEHRDRARRSLVAQEDVELRLPFTVHDYVDFYSSIEHATNLGRLMRPGQEPLLPNWRHLPVGYHGRSSTIVVSGTDVRRPQGQTRAPDVDAPSFGPCRMLDFELEVGFVTGGRPNQLGEPVDVDDAESRIFGLVLVNDWSARDIQAWEYQPLGPFLAKSFATSISPWVVPLAAFDPFRVDAPAQDPPPLPYLAEQRRRGIALDLEVELNGTRVTRTNFRHMYWTMAQQLAHMTVSGTVVRPGDIYASGTVSGAEAGTQGSLIELTKRGAEPIMLADGSTRSFLEDGDHVVMRGYAATGSTRVGFGSVEGTIERAVSSAP